MAHRFRSELLALAFVSLFLASPAVTDINNSATGIYQLDQKLTFNVLDAVTQDSMSGQITLVGHNDSRFGNIKIPYLEHLATLLESSDPEFSLEWTNASKAQIDALFRRLDNRQEMDRMAREWGKMFDQNGQPTASGRYFLPLLGIRPLGGSWNGVDQFGRIGAMYRAAGNEVGAETIELYGKFQSEAQGGGEFSNAILEMIQVAGKNQELREIRKRYREKQMSDDSLEDEVTRLVAKSLDSGLGLKGNPAETAYLRGRGRGLAPGKAYDESVVPEVNDQLQRVGHDILESLFDRVNEVQIPAEVMAETAGVPALEVVPSYYGIDPHSQLARLFFDADYLGKTLPTKPELTGKIPGYQTEFAYERSHPILSPEAAKHIGDRGISSHCRLWFTIDRIDLVEASDHRAIATRAAKIKINISTRSEVSAANAGCLEGYGELLTAQYDELALQFPILHELQEAAKLAGVARWLKKQQPGLQLPQQGRNRWTGHERAPGLVFMIWSPHEPQPGAPAISAMAEGGVSFKVSSNATMPVQGKVDAIAVENCPDVPPPAGGAPIGWTTGGASGDEFILTISTKTASASDGQFLRPSPKGYAVLWSPTAASSQFFNATCQKTLRNSEIAAAKPVHSQYADLLNEIRDTSDAPKVVPDGTSTTPPAELHKILGGADHGAARIDQNKARDKTCIGYERTFDMEKVARLAFDANFRCDDLAQAIALMGVESEVTKEGKYHPDLKCNKNGDGSTDLGLWQINDYPWRADHLRPERGHLFYDQCEEGGAIVTCDIVPDCKRQRSAGRAACDERAAAQTLPLCCRTPSKEIENLAFDDVNAARYAYKRWQHKKLRTEWRAYNTPAFKRRYRAALEYVQRMYPECGSYPAPAAKSPQATQSEH